LGKAYTYLRYIYIMSHNDIVIESDLKAEILKAVEMYVSPSARWDEYKRDRRAHYKCLAMNRGDLKTFRENRGTELRAHVNTITASFAAVMELLLNYQACCQVENDRKRRKEIREQNQNKRAKGNLDNELIKQMARQDELKRLIDCDILLVGDISEKKHQEEDVELGKEHFLLQENEMLKHKHEQQQQKMEQLLQKQQEQIQMLIEQQKQKQEREQEQEQEHEHEFDALENKKKKELEELEAKNKEQEKQLEDLLKNKKSKPKQQKEVGQQKEEQKVVPKSTHKKLLVEYDEDEYDVKTDALVEQMGGMGLKITPIEPVEVEVVEPKKTCRRTKRKR